MSAPKFPRKPVLYKSSFNQRAGSVSSAKKTEIPQNVYKNSSDDDPVLLTKKRTESRVMLQGRDCRICVCSDYDGVVLK